MITENVSTLKIHKLSQEQYDRELAAGNIDNTALYLTPGEEVIPIEKGGTGATSVEDVRTNIGVLSVQETTDEINSVRDLIGDTSVSEQITQAIDEHNESVFDSDSGELLVEKLPVVPIESGGTGATTAEEALNNLSLYSQEQADRRFMKIASDLTNTDRDIDKITEAGFYYGKNVGNSPFEYMCLEVGVCNMSSPETRYFQKITDCQNGNIAIRYGSLGPSKFTGVEWEYENPPMELGVEYKTTERHNGEAVYVECGELDFTIVEGNSQALPTYNLSVSDNSINVVSFDCYVIEPSSLGINSVQPCPFITEDGQHVISCCVFGSTVNVFAKYVEGYGGNYKVRFKVKYTKSTSQ